MVLEGRKYEAIEVSRGNAEMGLGRRSVFTPGLPDQRAECLRRGLCLLFLTKERGTGGEVTCLIFNLSSRRFSDPASSLCPGGAVPPVQTASTVASWVCLQIYQ